jgi:hypothetical protein
VEVLQAICPSCRLRFPVGVEYGADPGLRCHCPGCGTEFSHRDGGRPDASRPAG